MCYRDSELLLVPGAHDGVVVTIATLACATRHLALVRCSAAAVINTELGQVGFAARRTPRTAAPEGRSGGSESADASEDYDADAHQLDASSHLPHVRTP